MDRGYAWVSTAKQDLDRPERGHPDVRHACAVPDLLPESRRAIDLRYECV